MTIDLGAKVKDTITGFEGTAVARHEYLSGWVRITVQPNRLHDHKPVEAQTFDVEQLELIENAPPKVQIPPSATAPGMR